MSLIVLENENFDEVLSGKKVLVDFYASWCGPCKMIAPILEQMQSEVDFDIVKIDVDKHTDIAQKYGVMSIPTLVAFDNGKEYNKHIGFATKDVLIDLMENK